jgi:hypothetical protein
VRPYKKILFSVVLVLFAITYGYGQNRGRRLEKRPTKNDPLKLIKAEVGDKVFDEDNKVLAGKEWLSELKLEIKNVSGKPIVYASIFIQVEKAGIKGSTALQLVFGRMPPIDFTLADLEKYKKLQPNESVKIAVPQSELGTFEAAFGTDEIENAKYFFDTIIFDDETAWQRGQTMRRTPENRWHDIRFPIKEVSGNPLIMKESDSKSLSEQKGSTPCGSKRKSGFFSGLFNVPYNIRINQPSLCVAS